MEKNSMRGLTSWAVLAGMAFIVANASAQPSTAPSDAASEQGQRLSWKTNPLLDLHFLVRSAADGSAARPDLSGIDDVITGVSEVEKQIGGPLAWGFLEGALTNAETAEQATTFAPRLPERFNLPSGASVELRASFLRLAELYARVEPEFREKIWPQHSAAIDAVKQRLAAELEPRLEDCFNDLTGRLKMGYSGGPIPVFLVNKAPFPQGFTHRSLGGAVCIVGVDGLDGSLLYEVILHEATHALDVATMNQPTVLSELRRRLTSAGMTPRSPAMRNVVHTLFFVQAGETVRRVIDPNHKHYGDSVGYYEKLPKVVAAVRPAWVDHLDGKLSRDEAIDAIVKATVADNGE